MSRKSNEQPVRRRLAEREAEQRQEYQISRTISDSSTKRVKKSQRDKVHRTALRRKRFHGFVFFCVFVSLIAALALSQIYFDSVYVSFNEDTDKVVKSPDFDKIARLTKEYLNDHPAQRVSFLLDQSDLNRYIQKEMPEIENAKLQKANLFSSSLTLSLRHPVAKYGDAFVDASGTVFSQNHYNEPTINIIDNSGANVEGLTAKFLSFVGQVITGLKGQELAVESVVVPSGAVRFVEFRINGVGYPFKAQIDREATGQVADIINMKKYIENKGIIPSYVDVRVEGRGYYR
ncbi:MAG: hypothetical protein LBK50_00115 [Candidatus Nomurabacteria bacterium]|jgi:hypothetical protein|nr:hypothetical protein [Candidatus Nomurabacteria bacterium]